MTSSTTRTSAEEAVERFDTAQAASKYAASLGGTATHRREVQCITRALAAVPAGARVLDLPCGTGRLLPPLMQRGYQVTEADSSIHMIEQARAYAAACHLHLPPSAFIVTSVMHTPFDDDAFEAVVCNRLLHHFREPQVRRQALGELRRICRGPIVASFFCNLAIDAAVFHLKDALRGGKATDRIPIHRRTLAADAHAAGLGITRWMATRPGVSKQWYAVMVRR